jgi:hypothetical protein
MDDGSGTQMVIEWIVGGAYDRVEGRFGRIAALFVGLVVALSLLGLIVATAWYFLLAG